MSFLICVTLKSYTSDEQFSISWKNFKRNLEWTSCNSCYIHLLRFGLNYTISLTTKIHGTTLRFFVNLTKNKSWKLFETNSFLSNMTFDRLGIRFGWPISICVTFNTCQFSNSTWVNFHFSYQFNFYYSSLLLWFA